jgi:hypothetical protein
MERVKVVCAVTDELAKASERFCHLIFTGAGSDDGAGQ